MFICVCLAVIKQSRIYETVRIEKLSAGGGRGRNSARLRLCKTLESRSEVRRMCAV